MIGNHVAVTEIGVRSLERAVSSVSTDQHSIYLSSSDGKLSCSASVADTQIAEAGVLPSENLR